MKKIKQSESNVIDLLRHPKYIKRLLDEDLIEARLKMIKLDGIFKHFNHLEKLNKEVHKLNKRVEKKLDKLLNKKNKDDDGSH